jgi:hypothetical protein
MGAFNVRATPKPLFADPKISAFPLRACFFWPLTVGFTVLVLTLQILLRKSLGDILAFLLGFLHPFTCTHVL